VREREVPPATAMRNDIIELIELAPPGTLR
jgi:hypothetical protein